MQSDVVKNGMEHVKSSCFQFTGKGYLQVTRVGRLDAYETGRVEQKYLADRSKFWTKENHQMIQYDSIKSSFSHAFKAAP